MYRIKYKKLLLMLYVHRMFVVSSLGKNDACAHIHSSHIGCFLDSVSNTIYRWVMKYSWCWKKWQYMCDMYSNWKIKFEMKITQCWRDSYVPFDEASPYLLHHIYEVLIVFFWFPQRIKHCNSGPIDIDIEQDLVEAVDTHIYRRNVGYIIIMKLKW